jgi:hypothetical protein
MQKRRPIVLNNEQSVGCFEVAVEKQEYHDHRSHALGHSTGVPEQHLHQTYTLRMTTQVMFLYGIIVQYWAPKMGIFPALRMKEEPEFQVYTRVLSSKRKRENKLRTQGGGAEEDIITELFYSI